MAGMAGAAIDAEVALPYELAVDAAGNLYFQISRTNAFAR